MPEMALTWIHCDSLPDSQTGPELKECSRPHSDGPEEHPVKAFFLCLVSAYAYEAFGQRSRVVHCYQSQLL